MHQRCYPSRATPKYIIPSRAGIEFVDLKKEHWTIHNFTRGGCIYGIIPANGLIYTPANACACYIEAKLAEQSELNKGKQGGLMWAVSASTGKKLAEYKLASLPVWDGMAAPNGRLYMTTLNGDVVSFEPNTVQHSGSKFQR